MLIEDDQTEDTEYNQKKQMTRKANKHSDERTNEQTQKRKIKPTQCDTATKSELAMSDS